MRGKMGRSPCVCACVCVLINTTMKVGCAEASGTLGRCLLATDHRYVPIHTTSIIQCLMYLENDLNELAELWLKRQKKKKYYVCIFSQRVFHWIMYLQLCIRLTEGSLCDFRVWKGLNLWCLPSTGTDSQVSEITFDPLMLFLFSEVKAGN